MDYYERLRFETLERQYLEPPDESDDYDEYDERWYESEDLEYESWREDRLLDKL